MTNTTDKSILTAAGKALLAQLNAEEMPLVIDKMIFANVPNRPEFPQPDDVVPSDDVVHEAAVEQRGRLSVDSVIYSTTLTSQEGPFEFNWTGAYCSEYGVLVTIDHHALTPKTADEPGVAGNTLVRSVVLEYKDIAEITNITVDASTWQYNATPRMKKMDDDVAQAIIDQNGKDWFIEDGFLVTPQASAFNIKAGAGYASGNRVTLEFDRNVQAPNKPSFIYIDAHREGTPTGEQVTLFDFVVTAEEKDDYTDANGVKHFVCKIAQVLVDGSVSDLRQKNDVTRSVERATKRTAGVAAVTEAFVGLDISKLIGKGLAHEDMLWVVPKTMEDGAPLPKPAELDNLPDSEGNVTINSGSSVKLQGGMSNARVSALSGAIARTFGAIFDDTINVKNWGADNGGSKDNAEVYKRIEAFVNALLLPGGGGQPNGVTIYHPDGSYFTNYGGNFSTSKVPVKIKGDGSSSSKIIAGPDIGQGGKLFSFDKKPSSRLHGHGCLEGITFTGTNSDTDPILYSALSSQETKINDFKTRSHRNIGMLVSGCFNCEYTQFEIFGDRYAKNLHKELPDTATFNFTAGENTLTANEPVFDSGDVGKDIVVHSAGGRELQTISAYISPTQVTITDTFQRTDTEGRMSFYPVLVTATSGNDVIALSSPVAHETMIGRVVIIPRAKGHNNALVVTIIEVVSPSELRLDRVVPVSVVNEDLIFGGGMLILTDAPDGSLIESEVNDLQMIGGRVEGNGGTQIYVENAIHVGLANVKLHGSVRGNTFAASDWLAVLSGVDSIHLTGDFVHGFNRKGRIRIMGDSHLIQFGDYTVTSMEKGIRYFIYAPDSDINYASFGAPFRISVGAGGIWGNAFDGEFANASVERIYAPYPVGMPHGEEFIGRYAAKAYRSHLDGLTIQDNTAIKIPVLVPNGILQIADQSLNRTGLIHFAAGGATNPLTVSEFTSIETVNSTPLNGNTGQDGKLTISYVESESVIYVENRVGSPMYTRYLVMN